jgi:hypothetical protein
MNFPTELRGQSSRKIDDVDREGENENQFTAIPEVCLSFEGNSSMWWLFITTFLLGTI